MTSTSPFTSLLEGLQVFHARVQGTEGNFRLALLAAGQPSLVRQVSRSTLQIVRDLLVWLRDGIEAVEKQLLPIDALLALGEVAAALLQELGHATTSALPGLGPAFADVTSSVAALGQAIESFPAPALLPTPELVAALRTVLEQLVGTTGATPPAGALGELLHEIEQLAA